MTSVDGVVFSYDPAGNAESLLWDQAHRYQQQKRRLETGLRLPLRTAGMLRYGTTRSDVVGVPGTVCPARPRATAVPTLATSTVAPINTKSLSRQPRRLEVATPVPGGFARQGRQVLACASLAHSRRCQLLLEVGLADDVKRRSSLVQAPISWLVVPFDSWRRCRNTPRSISLRFTSCTSCCSNWHCGKCRASWLSSADSPACPEYFHEPPNGAIPPAARDLLSPLSVIGIHTVTTAPVSTTPAHIPTVAMTVAP